MTNSGSHTGSHPDSNPPVLVPSPQGSLSVPSGSLCDVLRNREAGVSCHPTSHPSPLLHLPDSADGRASHLP